jgi:hypothetical protein
MNRPHEEPKTPTQTIVSTEAEAALEQSRHFIEFLEKEAPGLASTLPLIHFVVQEHFRERALEQYLDAPGTQQERLSRPFIVALDLVKIWEILARTNIRRRLPPLALVLERTIVAYRLEEVIRDKTHPRETRQLAVQTRKALLDPSRVVLQRRVSIRGKQPQAVEEIRRKDQQALQTYEGVVEVVSKIWERHSNPRSRYEVLVDKFGKEHVPSWEEDGSFLYKGNAIGEVAFRITMSLSRIRDRTLKERLAKARKGRRQG